MTDDFSWWTNALAGKRGPIHDGEPQSGYYRNRKKDKTFTAIAYWKDGNDGSQRCHENGRDVEEMRAMEQWPFASKYPIPEAHYWTFLETGKWPDDGAAVMEPVAEDTPKTTLAKQIAELKVSAAKYAKIESDEAAGLAQTIRSKLTELAGKADKLRVAEKEPHLQAGREIDAEWQPIVKSGKDAADGIRSALTAWENFKRQAAADAARRADEANRAAAAKAAAEGNPAPEPSQPVLPMSNAPAPSAQIRGGSGRAASVSEKDFAVVQDIVKVFDHFKGEISVLELLTQLAQRSIDAGIDVPGVTKERKAVVR